MGVNLEDQPYSMVLTLAGSVFFGFVVATGFWVFGDGMDTGNISWVILCTASAVSMLYSIRQARFFSPEFKHPLLFDANRRCWQALITFLFLSVFCGAMSWIVSGLQPAGLHLAGLQPTGSVSVMSGIYGFNSVMFLTASLIYYMHIDVNTLAKL